MENGATHQKSSILNSKFKILNSYDRAMDFCLRHQKLLMTATLLTIPLCVVLFMGMRKERMPEIDSDETIVRIDWNENITLDENRKRIEGLDIKDERLKIKEMSAAVGTQDYMTGDGEELTTAEAEVYFKTSDPALTVPLQEAVAASIREEYLQAVFSFSKADNIFEKIFSSDEPDIEARIHSAHGNSDMQGLLRLHNRIAKTTGEALSPIPVSQQIELIADRERLALYNVAYPEVERAIKTAFKGIDASTLRSFSRYTPIEIANEGHTVGEAIAGIFVKSRPDKEGTTTYIPLRELITSGRSSDLKTITAGADGEYIPIAFEAQGREKATMDAVRSAVER